MFRIRTNIVGTDGSGTAHRAVARAAASVLGLSAALAVGVISPALAVPAAGAAPAVLDAAAAAAGTGDCSTPANACTLATALADVVPGGTIDLVTPGTAGHYVGNWSVGTAGTTATAPVTIQAKPGLASPPELDGNKGAKAGCSTAPSAPCNGPVLTVPANEYVALTGITITHGYNNGAGAGGLYNGGTVTITASTFTGNRSYRGAAINNGGTGSVTVTASTFTGNGTVNKTGLGGAIDTGDGRGNTGSVTVTASTFSGNRAFIGGAIASGDEGGGGTVTVTASTFANNVGGREGGAIDASDLGGGGTVTVTASTFFGNSASLGGAIDNADGQGLAGGGTLQVVASTFVGNSGATILNGYEHNQNYGTVQVAGDVFDGFCNNAMGTWTDGGYNAGIDGSCLNSGTGDINAGSSAALNLGPLARHGGPTQTILPGPGSKAIAIMPQPTSVTLGGGSVSLCPASDQRGYVTLFSGCDAGAVQTTGIVPVVLQDSAAPANFNAVGQVITFKYRLTNFSLGTLTGISVTDPAVPGISCPVASLPHNYYEDCSGSYTVTAADLAAGKITDTATATGTPSDGVPITSKPAKVTLYKGWPTKVYGFGAVYPGSPEGYYLGLEGSTWLLLVSNPEIASVPFTGKIRVPAGTLGHLTVYNPVTGQQVTKTGTTITFSLPDSGQVTGFQFTTTARVPSITFTLNIAGQPATANQVYLGGNSTPSATGSPLTFTR
jgi:hypothetical protein